MTQPAPATTYKPRSRKLWWSVTAALLLAVIAAAMLVNAAAGQPANREVANDDGTISHECNPSRQRMCTPYSSTAYKRECDSNHLSTKASEIDGRSISLDGYIKEIDKLAARYQKLPAAIAAIQADIALATHANRIQILTDRKAALETELADLNRKDSNGVSRIVVLRNNRDSMKSQRDREMNKFDACEPGQPVFHTAPNFCPKVLPDGRVRYSQANCRNR